MKRILFIIFIFSITTAIFSQTAGDFQSKTTGSWTSFSTWQTYNGSEWEDAATTPTSASGVVTILNGHTVTINSTLTIDQTIVDAGGILTVDLSSSETLTINNGTGDDLTVNGTLNLDGVLSNGGNGLTGSGKTVINGTCNWISGHITSTDFNIASSGVMNMEGSGECRINWDGVVNNAGTVNFAKSGVAFVMYYNGTFNNLNGGVFEATTNQSIYHRNDLSSGNMPEFNNAGIFRKKTGTGTTTVYKMEFNNTGTVDVQTGTLKFYDLGKGTHSGTFTIASGAKILSDYCTQNFSEGSEINGAGEFETVHLNNCNMSGTGNGTVIGSDITFKLSENSTLNGDGKLSVNGTFEWTSTGFIEVEVFIISQGGKLNISGDNRKTFRAYPHGTNKIDNYGTITWTGTGAIGGYGPINNKSTGVTDIQNDATLDCSDGAWTVINDGLIKKSAGTGTSRFCANLTNNGTLQIETGTLDLYYGTFTNYSDNSGHPRLNGGIYNLHGKLKFKAQYDRPIEGNNAEIILDGSESGILLFDGSNALINLASITADGSLTLRNSRDFSSGAAAFTNYGTLDCGSNVFSNNGNFTNADNAWLIIGSPDGIASSGSSGNIQSSGTRTFHTGGKYYYNGTSAQVTGSGLPATVRNLKIEKGTGVTLNSGASVTDTLALNEGALTTGANILTLGTSAASVGTLTRTNGKIIGNFKRWIAAETVNDILFPIGTANNYRPANISFTSAPTTGGTLTTFFTSSNPGTAGLPLNDGEANIQNIGQDGYWTITPDDGLSGGTYNIDLTADGFSGIVDYTKLHLLKRENSGSNWTASGTHSVCTGTNECPGLHRVGLGSFSEFGVGSTSENPLPVELTYFEGTATEEGVMLSWETETEVNNYGFEILCFSQNDSHSEDQSDEESWEKIGFAQGHGNSNSPKYYSYKDEKSGSGTISYRLRQIDTDGKFEYSEIVVIEIDERLPTKFELYQNYPNPFNPSTRIKFDIPDFIASPDRIGTKQSVQTSLKIYDILGREVTTLVNDYLKPGNYEVNFDGSNLSGGVYFYRIKAGNEYQSVKKMLLLK
ncbi:MAG: T9SS type A sorting domain-containing protein [Melioribacteraceae bacterium]|nr:T9SS type A sorting domain-containing protein [Melioribacteraceae bacterium]